MSYMGNSEELDNVQSEEEKVDSTPTPKTSRGLHGPSLGIGAGIAIVSIISAFLAVDIMDTSSELQFEEDSPTVIPTQQPTPPPGPQIIQGLLDDDPVKGNPDATVTIVEFSDFQCPFCARFYDQTLPLIQQNYIDTGKIKFVYRDFPIDSIHPNARPAHFAAECADEQGKFWDYHDILFERVNEWQNLPRSSLGDKLIAFSDELELDQTRFISCLQSETVAKEIQSDYLDGGRYGITGTPGFFIGNEERGYIKISGAQPYSSFQNVLDQMLAN